MFLVNTFRLICITHFIIFGLVLVILHYFFPYSSKYFYSLVGECVLFIAVLVLSFTKTKRTFLNDKVRPGEKAVLITGCNSGFGFHLAKHLDSKGYHVFASGRKNPSAPDLRRLKSECSGRLHILELDVTKEESVKKAYEYVTSKLLWLEFWAVVNNAGGFYYKRSDFSTLQDYQHSLEVNCLGMVRVTKTFLPLIRKNKGRIINITSFAGRIAFPNMSPYVTSKFGAVGFSDSLRHELNIWEVPVISIEPDLFRTNLLTARDIDVLADTMISSLDADILEYYGKEYFDVYKRNMTLLVQNASANIHLVIECIDSAISLVHPDVVYRPCGKFWSKVLIRVYEVMSPNFHNALMKLLMRKSMKPKLANKVEVAKKEQ